MLICNIYTVILSTTSVNTLSSISISLVGCWMKAKLVIHISASVPVISFPLISSVINLREACVPTIGTASRKNFLKLTCKWIIKKGLDLEIHRILGYTIHLIYQNYLLDSKPDWPLDSWLLKLNWYLFYLSNYKLI